MPYLMRQRKPLAPIRAILVDRDDGSVVASDNPRFAALQLAITDATPRWNAIASRSISCGSVIPKCCSKRSAGVRCFKVDRRCVTRRYDPQLFEVLQHAKDVRIRQLVLVASGKRQLKVWRA